MQEGYCNLYGYDAEQIYIITEIFKRMGWYCEVMDDGQIYVRYPEEDTYLTEFFDSIL